MVLESKEQQHLCNSGIGFNTVVVMIIVRTHVFWSDGDGSRVKGTAAPVKFWNWFQHCRCDDIIVRTHVFWSGGDGVLESMGQLHSGDLSFFF